MNGRVVAGLLSLLLMLGCERHLKVPSDDVHSSLSPQFLESTHGATYGMEETSSEIRATVLEAIQRDMLRTGRYPKVAIQNTDLRSLTPIAPNQVTGNSTWNYKALVRVNLERNSVDVSFIAFERNGEIIVRKVSV